MKKVMLLISMLALMLGSASVVLAHDNSGGSVFVNGQGQEFLVFQNNMTDNYDQYGTFAINEWRGYADHHPGEGVQILNATSTTRPTTVILRVYCDVGGNHGEFDDRADPDVIRLNRCELDDNGDAERKNTATHEVGHALWFGHNEQNDSIMNSPTYRLDFVGVNAHDHADYHDTWIQNNYPFAASFNREGGWIDSESGRVISEPAD